MLIFVPMNQERFISVLEGSASGVYENVDQVAEAIVADPNTSYHHVEIPLEGAISVAVSGRYYKSDPDEKLILEYCGQKATIKRTVDGHHGVSTNYESFCYMIIDVSDYEDPYIDRGVCWVHSGNPGTLVIGIIRERPMGVEQAKIALQKCIFRTKEVMDEILSGSGNLTLVDR